MAQPHADRVHICTAVPIVQNFHSFSGPFPLSQVNPYHLITSAFCLLWHGHIFWKKHAIHEKYHDYIKRVQRHMYPFRETKCQKMINKYHKKWLCDKILASEACHIFLLFWDRKAIALNSNCKRILLIMSSFALQILRIILGVQCVCVNAVIWNHVFIDISKRSMGLFCKYPSYYVIVYLYM